MDHFESNNVHPKLKMSDFNISSNKSSFIRNDFDIKYDNKGSFLNVMNKDSNNNLQGLRYKCDISPISFKNNKVIEDLDLITNNNIDKTELHGLNSTGLISKIDSPPIQPKGSITNLIYIYLLNLFRYKF